jgi:uroporphyrinogen-III synthase
MPAQTPDGVILSSAAAVRHAGQHADAFKALPAFAVGEATAAAAHAAGWTDVAAGPGTMQALLDGLGAGNYLHLAGADLTPVTVPPSLNLMRVTVYETPPLSLSALPEVDVVLLHSPRTAAQFAREWDRLGGERAHVQLLAISQATLASAGGGWGAAQAAAEPSEPALLAMLPKAL